MMAELKPYPKMKDSGVEWLGMVPEHWEIERAKNLFTKRWNGSRTNSIRRGHNVFSRRYGDSEKRSAELIGFTGITKRDRLSNWNPSG